MDPGTAARLARWGVRRTSCAAARPALCLGKPPSTRESCGPAQFPRTECRERRTAPSSPWPHRLRAPLSGEQQLLCRERSAAGILKHRGAAIQRKRLRACTNNSARGFLKNGLLFGRPLAQGCFTAAEAFFPVRGGGVKVCLIASQRVWLARRNREEIRRGGCGICRKEETASDQRTLRFLRAGRWEVDAEAAVLAGRPVEGPGGIFG